jgi:DNA mismatch repair protein MutS
MLIDDYFEYQIKFEKKYGSRTIVLMQVGTFFEFYGVNNETEKIGDAQTVAEILNIQLSRRNKAILENSRCNALMAGFPLNSLKRFINILINNSYTVILIEQVTDPPNPKREITNIYSPGTYIEEINQSDPNHIVSVYVTEELCYKTGKIIFSFGLAAIDLSTGYNVVYEAHMMYYEKAAFLEEIYRFIESYNPKEIVVFYNLDEQLSIKLEDLRNKINFVNRNINFRNTIDTKYFKLDYQNEFLKKIFQNNGFLSPVEYLDLEKKNYARLSYILLLQFAYEHNERIINKIMKPIHWNYEHHLILYNNSIYQLNIIPTSNNDIKDCNSKFKSLFHIIQKTSTAMGKRLLKYRILNPITNIEELNKRYELTGLFLNSGGLLLEIEKILRNIIDIERMHRKISLNMLHPYEFLNLTYSYESIKSLLHLIGLNFDLKLFGLDIDDNINNIKIDIISNFYKFMEEYESIYDLKEIGKYGFQNISNSFFKKGYFKEIDMIQLEIDEINIFFNKECEYLSNLIEPGSDFIKLENNDKDGYFLYTTKKRSEILLSKFSTEEKANYEIKKYIGSNIKIVSKKINEYSDNMINYREKIKILTKDKYIESLKIFEEKYFNTLCEITKFVALIDIIKCSALCAKIYKYCKPEIKNTANGNENGNENGKEKSYFKASEIRHPIIEIINEEYNYVTNDIELVHERCNGILLYGVNGVGKSSLSKAVGCNIVLAQMGFYVAASQFIYYPYNKIFTRINGDDNIFKGMSSYAVEMDELRSILKYSDNRSIVLGDEICKGTEETSALAVVSASIKRFCKNNVNFILATHFHKLDTIQDMKQLLNIKFMHLSVEYEYGTYGDKNKIIYGRKLKEGVGSNLYGIEIAEFIIEDDAFIIDARNIRNEILNKDNEILVSKTSNYNSKLYVDICSICGSTGNAFPLDTHHIKEQHMFDNGDYNKDKLANLVVLCKTHHDEVHYGNLEIYGYKNTTCGKELDYKYINDDNIYKNKEDKEDEEDKEDKEDEENNKKKINIDINSEIIISKKNNNGRKKYSEEQIIMIKKMFDELKDYKEPFKVLIQELKKEKNINISSKILSKICNNEY